MSGANEGAVARPLAPSQGAAAPARASWLAALLAARAWLFLALLLVGFETWARLTDGTTFVLNPFNIRSILVAAVAPLLLAIGQTFVIISGGIDLSVGFTMGLSAVVVSQVANLATPMIGTVLGLLVAMAATLLAGAGPGVVNGWLIARLRIPPFIGTLGMYGVARGIAYLLAGGTTVPVDNPALAWLGNGELGGLPVILLITAAILLATHYLLGQTRFGQYTYAIGGNRQAALRAGIDVRGMTLRLYVLSAISAAVGGILYAGRFSAGAAPAGEPLLLDSIAAVVIGGASLFGGSGTVIGTLIGALIVAVIQYGLVFMDVAPFWQFVAVGLVIIISVLVDQSQRRLGGGRVDE